MRYVSFIMCVLVACCTVTAGSLEDALKGRLATLKKRGTDQTAQQATVSADTVMKCAVISNATFMGYASEARITVFQRGLVTFLTKAIAGKQIEADDRALVEDVVNLLETFDPMAFVISGDLPDSGIPNGCAAIKCGKAVDLSQLLTLIKKYDTKNKTMCLGQQNNTILLYMGMLTITTMADNHVLLICATSKIKEINENIQKKQEAVLHPEASKGMNANGSFYGFWYKTATWEKLLQQDDDDDDRQLLKMMADVKAVNISDTAATGLSKAVVCNVICNDADAATRQTAVLKKMMKYAGTIENKDNIVTVNCSLAALIPVLEKFDILDDDTTESKADDLGELFQVYLKKYLGGN